MIQWHLFLAMILLSTAESLTAEDESDFYHVFIVLHGDSGVGAFHGESHELLARSTIKSMGLTKHPRAILIRASSWSDVIHQLEEKIPERAKIKTLFLGTHGKTFVEQRENDQSSKLILGPTKKDLFELELRSQHSDEWTLNETARRFFQFFRSRFSISGSKVILPNCHVFEKNEAGAQRMAKSWAKLLGISAVEIYGLYTPGSFPLIFGKVPWNLKSGISRKLNLAFFLYGVLALGSFFAHPILPLLALGLPTYVAYQKFIIKCNQGYCFQFESDDLIQLEYDGPKSIKRLSFWTYQRSLYKKSCRSSVTQLSSSDAALQ